MTEPKHTKTGAKSDAGIIPHFFTCAACRFGGVTRKIQVWIVLGMDDWSARKIRTLIG